MEPQGYRAQAESPESGEQAAPQPARTSSKSAVLVGVLAIVGTAAAITALMIMTSRPVGGGAQGPGATTEGMPGGMDDALTPGELGSPSAPVHVVAYPGHCEGNMRAVEKLRGLADEFPETLHVTIGTMGSPEAMEQGLTCASYLLKAEGAEGIGALGATPDGYEILFQKSPDVSGWTPEELDALVREVVARFSGGAPADPAAEPEGSHKA